MEPLAAGFFLALAIWFFAICRSYEERRRVRARITDRLELALAKPVSWSAPV
jgi:hypothetical protein